MDSRLDAIDLAILNALQADGRMSNSSLAEAVRLSPTATLRRVRKLEELGVIQRYTAIVNANMVGCGTSIFVDVTLDDQREKTLRAFEEAAFDCANILACHLVVGQADYVLHVIADGVADYERVHKELATLPGVARIRSSVALRTVYRRTHLPIA